MSLPSDDTRFLDLLHKWQAGDFTRSDEQELQALARSDDFRREALEGFLQQPGEDHRDRLLALRARLQPVGAVRRGIFPQMMAAAAVLVLLFAAIWFFQKPVTDTPQAIVQNEAPQEDSAPLSDAAPPPPPAASAPEASKSIARAPEAVPPSMPEKEQALAKPRPSRNIADDQAGAGVFGNASVAQPAAAAPQDKSADIAMQEEAAIPQELNAASDSKKESESKARASSKSDKKLPGQPAPANAMQNADDDMLALQEYLRMNARLPEAARQNNVSGFVRIRFRLDAQRKARAFEVLHPLGYGCDESAIRLLENYNWRDFTQDSLTVEVPFVR